MTRAREQAGIALPIALAVLLIASLLVSAAVLAATQSNDLSNRDTRTKAALEAADAGLRFATYRLNMVNPDPTYCVTTLQPPASGQPCAPTTDDLGNGATVKVWTTPAMTAGQTCAGLTVVADVDQRCITAIATVRGLAARTQMRAAAFTAKPVFAVPGLLGTNGLTIGNNAFIEGIGGTNAVANIGQGSSLTGTQLGPGGSIVKPGSGTGNPGVVTYTEKFQTSPIDPGTSATNTAPGGTCGTVNTTTYVPSGTNCDYRITNSLTNPPTQPYDPSSKITWNANTRQLDMRNNGSNITLGGGVYNFCDLWSGNNSSITIPAGVKVQIFIDSPSRSTGPGQTACPAGTTGTLNIANGTTIYNYSNDPTALQIYVYGNPQSPGTNQVVWNNNSATTSYVSLFAPYSTVNLQNNGVMYGGVSAWSINVDPNFTFHWDPRDKFLQGTAEGLFYRTSWKQCPSTPTSASDPQSGC